MCWWYLCLPNANKIQLSRLLGNVIRALKTRYTRHTLQSSLWSCQTNITLQMLKIKDQNCIFFLFERIYDSAFCWQQFLYCFADYAGGKTNFWNIAKFFWQSFHTSVSLVINTMYYNLISFCSKLFSILVSTLHK